MLLRDGPPGAGVEVFVFRRVAAMAFAAGMHVFPGGSVDERDSDPALPWSGPDPRDLAGPLSADPDLARALVVAAVRETFEECGVLLAEPVSGGPVLGLSGHGWSDAWQQARQDLLARRISMAELLAKAGLVLRADLVRPWAHWVTPLIERRRYDTRFFVAALPAGQQARDLGGEGEHAQWLAAGEGLRRQARGEAMLLPPTLVCLEELAAGGTVAAVLGADRQVRPVMPWPVRAADGSLVVEVDLDGVGGGELR